MSALLRIGVDDALAIVARYCGKTSQNYRHIAYDVTELAKAVDTIERRATPPAGAGEAVAVDAVALDRVLQAFFAEQRYTMTAAEKATLRIGLVDALSDLPPKGRHCDEGHTLEWCARDLMEAVNAYHRTTSGNDSRWMDTAARRVAAALAAPTPLPEAVRELSGKWRAESERLVEGLDRVITSDAYRSEGRSMGYEECADELDRALTGGDKQGEEG